MKGTAWALWMCLVPGCYGRQRFLEDTPDNSNNNNNNNGKTCVFTEDQQRICNYCTQDNAFCISEVCTETECSVCASKVDEFGYAVYIDFCIDMLCDAVTMACRCKSAKVYGIPCDSCSFCDGQYSFETVVDAQHIGEGMTFQCAAYEDTIATSTCEMETTTQFGGLVLTAVAVAFILFVLGAVSYRRRDTKHRLSRSEIRAALNLENDHTVT